MKMTFFKKNLLKIGLILALVVSVFLYIYTTVSYKTNTNVIKCKIFPIPLDI
ncbi:hypothetical protein CLMAG_39190 [Clostridium magnum DSM 2767]|uniref:Uncharacterized protein n=1 Tax=Clostridium magnum DSM 2767 TaxID=1121326 RepID=A0A161WVN8_9CLOT|nr:hypothetical protein CLMAG_39190 [Clostridium magnum DSM 2767]SHI65759.1 hypothetical protein SAMN02745944_04645 [Clostridium magnum DSM 2767]